MSGQRVLSPRQYPHPLIQLLYTRGTKCFLQVGLKPSDQSSSSPCHLAPSFQPSCCFCVEGNKQGSLEKILLETEVAFPAAELCLGSGCGPGLIKGKVSTPELESCLPPPFLSPSAFDTGRGTCLCNLKFPSNFLKCISPCHS